jgi:excisionase family DNA binding protein
MFEDELLTRVETAELLRIKPSTLARDVTHRRLGLPYVKMGHSVRYRRSDVEKFLDRSRRGDVSEDAVANSQ